jgi:hypothetical protein
MLARCFRATVTTISRELQHYPYSTTEFYKAAGYTAVIEKKYAHPRDFELISAPASGACPFSRRCAPRWLLIVSVINSRRPTMFKYVKFAELPVVDQDRAVKFYTEKARSKPRSG